MSPMTGFEAVEMGRLIETISRVATSLAPEEVMHGGDVFKPCERRLC
jgi:hypothetical protein